MMVVNVNEFVIVFVRNVNLPYDATPPLLGISLAGHVGLEGHIYLLGAQARLK